MKFSAKYAFDYYRTRLQTSDLSLGDQAIAGNGESWQEKLTTDNMSRGEENHFEHNIEFMFTGDKAFGEKFRLGYNVGSNIMYQQFETLTVGVKNMLDKNNWLFNTAERWTMQQTRDMKEPCIPYSDHYNLLTTISVIRLNCT